mmetsp:Transcript_13202/g.26230  ORF Transcript_13202/g.26230 Transcript_13202/m.26230 type:complete len:275 (-) Transcript_13202:386-1210(-)
MSRRSFSSSPFIFFSVKACARAALALPSATAFSTLDLSAASSPSSFFASSLAVFASSFRVLESSSEERNFSSFSLSFAFTSLSSLSSTPTSAVLWPYLTSALSASLWRRWTRPVRRTFSVFSTLLDSSKDFAASRRLTSSAPVLLICEALASPSLRALATDSSVDSRALLSFSISLLLSLRALSFSLSALSTALRALFVPSSTTLSSLTFSPKALASSVLCLISFCTNFASLPWSSWIFLSSSSCPLDSSATAALASATSLAAAFSPSRIWVWT